MTAGKRTPDESGNNDDTRIDITFPRSCHAARTTHADAASTPVDRWPLMLRAKSGAALRRMTQTKMARVKRAIFVSEPVIPNLVAGIGFEPMTFRL